jgi:hypothetical protein
MKIQLIRQLSELDGGEFLEIFPGPYKGRSWNEQSVYVEDRAFSLFEGLVKRHADNFDNRANTQISKEQWESIINDLEALSSALAKSSCIEDLKGHVSFRDATISGEFAADFQGNKAKLLSLIGDWKTWLRQELDNQTVISILGI